jgi:hypothetical protein
MTNAKKPRDRLVILRRQIQACARMLTGRLMRGVRLPESEREAAEAEIDAMVKQVEVAIAEDRGRAKN